MPRMSTTSETESTKSSGVAWTSSPSIRIAYRPTDAAGRIERLSPRVHFLVRDRPVQRGALRQIAPAAAGEVPHAVARVHRLHAVFPLHRLPQVAAFRRLVRTSGGRSIRDARDANPGAGHWRDRVRDARGREPRQTTDQSS